MQVSSGATTNEVQGGSSNTIPFDDDKVQPTQALEDEEEINMLFMLNETILFKDRKGLTREVTYLRPNFSEGVLKHRIGTRHDIKFLVDGVLLCSLDAPDISTVPISVERYTIKLQKLRHQQLEQISNPQTLDNNQHELMEIHYKLNHLPLLALITLAEKGKIIRKFVKLKDCLPACISCIFGQAHHKPWRSKGSRGSIQKESDDAPGKCISMDTLVSAQPGLIPQISGNLMNLQIWGATVFVDHFSDYVYVALMRDLGLDKTLLAKTAFERHASKGGVTIHSYQADNGTFADSGFQQAIKEASQTITFCAMGAHHQNGIIE